MSGMAVPPYITNFSNCLQVFIKMGPVQDVNDCLEQYLFQTSVLVLDQYFYSCGVL